MTHDVAGTRVRVPAAFGDELRRLPSPCDL